MKKIIIASFVVFLLMVLLAVSAFADSGLDNFSAGPCYAYEIFDDVAPTDWYHDSVSAVCSLGLMIGSDGSFDPGGSITVAQTVAIAARLNGIYTTGSADFEQTDPWYGVYYDYLRGSGVALPEGLDPDARATRRTVAVILAASLPAEAFAEINPVENGMIPDVKYSDEGAAEIYMLYRAGVLTGSDARGSFEPDSFIRRCDIAALISRTVSEPMRRRISLPCPPYPEVSAGPAPDDSFFSSSAMLGNSLVQGMQLYSGMEYMSFFAYQSTTVLSPNGYDPSRCFDRLLNERYDRVYIEYGINEIYLNEEKFTSAYSELIDSIRAAMPDAEIYVMAVTPVTSAVSGGGYFTMSKIRSFNGALYEMCREKECRYLDCCEALCDASGFLPSAYAGWDGSPHLSGEGYRAWADVIRAHCL
ncbi:MAG: S-layer homology domain-containing protein [Oscillospiraceae bacterium]|nr:S-layer homology domain-containing protein [Oscillospiraceae bacterium]